MKSCSRCGKQKKEGAFYKNARTKSGLRSECMECTKELARLYRIKTRPDTRDSIENEFLREFAEIASLCERLLVLVKKAERDFKTAKLHQSEKELELQSASVNLQ